MIQIFRYLEGKSGEISYVERGASCWSKALDIVEEYEGKGWEKRCSAYWREKEKVTLNIQAGNKVFYHLEVLERA